MTESIEINKIRRNERAQHPEWIEKFLTTTEVITISMIDEGQPYAVVRNFVYDTAKQVIYIHGARKGRAFEVLARNPRVCCTAQRMERLLPALKASGFSVEYAGVTVFGDCCLVDDQDEALAGLELLVNKYFHQFEAGVDYAPTVPEVTQVTAVFRIDIESWSGKQNQAAPDFPGAFTYQPKTEMP